MTSEAELEFSFIMSLPPPTGSTATSLLRRPVAPLRGVIEAYEGVPQSLMVLINQRSREVENSKEGNGGGFTIVGRCDGKSGNSCQVVS